MLTAKPLIAANGLTRSFLKGSHVIHALEEVSFEIAEGEFIGIVGRSGSGKSTLLNLIGGLDRPSGGTLRFAGTAMESFNRRQMARHRKFSVGMVFQSFNLIPARTASENITLALAFGGVPRPKRKELASVLLAKVSLSGRMNHKPSELSGGESQRVAIARAIANSPRLLLADEPTGNLDSQTASDILDLIESLNVNQGKTVIMVTHDMETARRCAHRIIRLKDGRIDEIIANRPFEPES